MISNFFLGANSSAGFQSLYEGFVDPEKNQDVIVLKGGPGAGKSSFMKYIGEQAEARGEDVEYIWCSGDPESLDAVRLPRLGILAVDGTSPHVVEPQYPAAVDRYVNLGRFYQVEKLKTLREEIMAHAKDYRAAYRQAYRALKAAGEVEQCLQDLTSTGFDQEKLRRRTAGIITRELGKQGGGTGEIAYRFLGGVTHRGLIWRFDTVETLCDRIYELKDSRGLGGEVLHTVAQAAVQRGYDVIACLDCNRLARLQHLILPELRLGFITTREGMEYTGKKPYRRIHIDAMADQRLQRQNRSRCRFHRRMYQLLMEEAIAGLQAAKASHDLLEKAYNPYVDFDGVYALAKEEWKRIEKQP